jgi:hypothetical protein
MTLERHILNILRRTHPAGLFETTLRAELHVTLSHEPGQIAFASALTNLQRLGWIAKGEDTLTKDVTWTLTEIGKDK